MNIRGDMKDITRHLDKSQRWAIPQSVPPALNKTVSKLNTKVKRAIAAELGLPQKAFRKQVKIFRANRRNWKAKEWIGTRKRIKVSKILHSQKLSEYYAKGIIDKSQNEIFKATMPNGHTGQFYRTTRKALPIQEVVLNLSEVAPRVLKKTVDRPVMTADFRRLLAHELQWRLNRIR